MAMALITALGGAGLADPGETPGERSFAWTSQAIRAVLEESDSAALLPELDEADPAAIARTSAGRGLVKWATQGRRGIPDTTYTLYRQFARTGERRPYEKPYFKKRELLTQEVAAAWLTAHDARIDRISDLVWSICEETTWVLPAHEQPGDDPYVDLFAAETASDLAHVVLVLGDRLPEEIRRRIAAEVDARVFQPYLGASETYWWRNGSNNWTGVCAGSIGEALLILERDPDRLAAGLALATVHLDRFLANAFTEEGVSLEGIGYWNYGLMHHVGFAEMLCSRTAGTIDLLAHPKFRCIAQYPAAVALDTHVFASFSDSHEEASIAPFLAARLAERTGERALFAQAGDLTSWRLSNVIRNVLWGGDGPRVAFQADDRLLPASGIARLVGNAGERLVVLAAKAGHNAEPHNQNDVGSFILRIGETTYLCDPGPGLYSRDYFNDKRYENVFANSCGHSVPRFGGALQQPGVDRRGTIERPDPKTLRIAFHDAYGLPELEHAERRLAIAGDGKVVIEGDYRFTGAGLDVEEALVTWRDVVMADDSVRVVSPEGALVIHAEGAVLAAERLEEACKANQKALVLTRITATYPADRQVNTRITCTYDPGS